MKVDLRVTSELFCDSDDRIELPACTSDCQSAGESKLSDICVRAEARMVNDS